ncbi:hypothetical protein DFS34DRAFT_629460 [Phlyctochytrium arcticum]|nr:hypothetical protein DFS34DRAFT_629460 [Phlyctochytrium arcticum]
MPADTTTTVQETTVVTETNLLSTPSKTSSSSRSVSAEPTYGYHGGGAPPEATEKVVLVQPIKETQEIKDIVTHETVAAVKRVEIQPVIDRERVRTEIQRVVQPILDVVTETPTIESVVDDIEVHTYKEKTRLEDIQKYESESSAFKDEIREAEVVHEKVYKEPIIHETIKTKIITEIQPVIERVIHKTHIIQETQPIKETFIKAPVIHEQEVATPITLDQFEAKMALNQSPIKPVAARALESSDIISSSTTTTTTTRKRTVNDFEAEDASITSETVEDDDTVVYMLNKNKPESPSIRGRVEKMLGAVEIGVGELIGSDKLVAKGEQRMSPSPKKMRVV